MPGQPNTQPTLRRVTSLFCALGIGLAGGVIAQTPVGSERRVNPLDTAGSARGYSIVGEAGEPGKAGGMGTVEPNPIQEVRAAYDSMFRTINRGVVRPVKVMEGEGTVRVATPPGFTWGVPLIEWAFRPEDAEIKIGNFYLDFRTLSGSLLYSDNATRSDPAVESGFISMIGWSFAAMFQATERLRLAVGLQMVYLPFEGKIGFIDPMEMFAFNATPRGLAQLSYTFPIGNWDVHLYDNFSVYTPSYIWGGAFDLFDTDYQAADTVGRYSYRIIDRNIQERADTFNRLFDYFVFRNTVGGHVSHLLPTETRFSAGAARYDIWSDGLPNEVPRSGERYYAALDNERENMRFKPHIHYAATHHDRQDGFSHTLMGGFRGPITDYLSLMGEAGYYWADNQRREALLWTLDLEHAISPTMSQRVYFQRSITWPLESVRTAIGYFFRKTLGPDLRMEVVGEYSEYDPVDLPQVPKYTEWQAGIRFMYSMSTRLGLRSGAYYRLMDNGTYEWDALTLRNELYLRATDTVDAMLMHQYQNTALTVGPNGWQENLLILTLRKSF